MKTTKHVVGLEEVQQVAWLARLKLSEQELATFATQLDEILRYVQQLQAVSTEQVEPTSHVVRLTNVTREDRATPSLMPAQVVQLAPAQHGQLVKVPKIVEI